MSKAPVFSLVVLLGTILSLSCISRVISKITADSQHLSKSDQFVEPLAPALKVRLENSKHIVVPYQDHFCGNFYHGAIASNLNSRLEELNRSGLQREAAALAWHKLYHLHKTRTYCESIYYNFCKAWIYRLYRDAGQIPIASRISEQYRQARNAVIRDYHSTPLRIAEFQRMQANSSNPQTIDDFIQKLQLHFDRLASLEAFFKIHTAHKAKKVRFLFESAQHAYLKNTGHYTTAEAAADALMDIGVEGHQPLLEYLEEKDLQRENLEYKDDFNYFLGSRAAVLTQLPSTQFRKYFLETSIYWDYSEKAVEQVLNFGIRNHCVQISEIETNQAFGKHVTNVVQIRSERYSKPFRAPRIKVSSQLPRSMQEVEEIVKSSEAIKILEAMEPFKSH